jgi:hypothetical protein
LLLTISAAQHIETVHPIAESSSTPIQVSMSLLGRDAVLDMIPMPDIRQCCNAHMAENILPSLLALFKLIGLVRITHSDADEHLQTSVEAAVPTFDEGPRELMPCHHLMRSAHDVHPWLVQLGAHIRHTCNLCRVMASTRLYHLVAGSRVPLPAIHSLLLIKQLLRKKSRAHHQSCLLARMMLSCNRRLCARVASRLASDASRKKPDLRKRRRNASAKSWSH